MVMGMSFASCKSNKQQAADTEKDSIPEALAGVEGVEKYQTKLDYSKAECWLERPAEATKAVDVFYIYPTVTGFRDPVQICEITDSELVAAYPIGFAVTKDFLNRTGLKFAEGADDTGVIVSWNTEGLNNKDAKNVTLAPGGISINPINWKRDDTYASVKENLGSLTVEGKLVTPGIADARVDTVRGSVIVTTVDAKLYAIPEDGAPLFGPECYHLHDYGFFYNNFKKNVADRIKAFTKQ